MTTAAVEEYLEAIYKLQQVEHPVRAASLAEKLGISPPAVTDMLKRLADQGLVYRTADLGVCLTPKGEGVAVGIVRRHRLSERLLTDILKIPWHRAHAEACKLEHVLSEEAVDGLEAALQHPKTCPHGNPIPERDGSYPPEVGFPLTELVPGEKGVIVRLGESYEAEPQLLQYLASLGLLPETPLLVEEVAPFEGPLLVRVGLARYALGQEVASKIYVRSLGRQHRHRRRGRGKA